MTELRIPDAAEREAALDPRRSFIVQAPAGSGKTELLIQRYLALLAEVRRPEEIAAITFTIKAAAEMRARILEALRGARSGARPERPHRARTWELARAALARNDALGWKLEESAERLRVQTIDALCATLTRQMPFLSRFGAQPEPIEDASALYAEAARNVLGLVEEEDPAAPLVERLLAHVDNNAAQAEKLLATMLAQRDHWIRTLREAHDRELLERALVEVRADAVERARAAWPEGLPSPPAGDADRWIAQAHALLTKTTGEWRKQEPLAQRLSADDALRDALRALQALPPARYEDEQWDALEAIATLAPRAVAELRLVFAAHGCADFIEFAHGALQALGTEDDPTDLLLALDYRIRHILVDEFQDTSYTQEELLKRLTSGWEPDGDRTIFLVGDPMQSIYRFREAEVGLFLKAFGGGIGGVKLEALRLRANFRSQEGIVSWVNRVFSHIMPAEEDFATGAVTYAPSEAMHPGEQASVVAHAFIEGDAAGEGRRVAEIAREALAAPVAEGAEPATVAILVRNRNHLLEVMPQLRSAKLAYRAIEIEPLGHRPVVQDLLALARALSHLGDRIAWLGVLRAPWCALTLADLLALASGEPVTIWEAMADAGRLERLTADGRQRLERTRAVLAQCLAQRRRASLRHAVEGAWLALGGPACVENATDLEDADIFLDHLEASEIAGTIGDLAAFEASVSELFALPDLAAPGRLQVMTIHKAKGLEFDTVIVPGLAAGSGRDDRKLFLWMETPQKSLLLAPVNPTGSGEDPIYEYIRDLDKAKADHENARLIYVAATRARRRLHLLAQVALDDHGAVKDPSRGSLLAKLWPAVAGDFRVDVARAPARPSASVAPAAQGALRRLDVGAFAYAIPPSAAWSAPPERVSEEIEFSWVGETARRVGSVVHRWLQRLAEDEARGWSRARLEGEHAAIANELAARGVSEADLEAAAGRVIAALSNAIEDPRGQWLLGPQKDARSEHRISAVVEGVTRTFVIDRLFVAADGTTWIADYKTSSHEGSALDRFLAEEEKRYRAQLDGYASALGAPDAKRGLYFPLLKAWREW